MKSYDNKEIKNRIEYYMKKQNLTRYRLSKKSGVKFSTLNNIFNRDTGLSLMNLSKIVLNGFEISMGEFLGEVEETSLDKTSSISDEEEAIIYKYRSLSKSNKKIVKKYIDIL